MRIINHNFEHDKLHFELFALRTKIQTFPIPKNPTSTKLAPIYQVSFKMPRPRTARVCS
jgi:hypothetical protein